MPSSHPRQIETIARGLALHNGKVLLCRSLKHDHAYLPGGHVEPGETAAEALAREFKEECGLSVTVGGFLVANEHTFTQRGKPKHEWNVVFHVEHAGGWPEQIVSEEEDIAFAWCDIAALPEAGFVPTPLLAWLFARNSNSEQAHSDTWITYTES